MTHSYSLLASTSRQTLPSSTLPATLALFHLPGVGATRYHKLIEWFGSAEAVISGDRKLILAAGIKAESVRLLDEYVQIGQDSKIGGLINRDLEWASESGNEIILIDDDDYPPLLKHIDCPPPVLFVRGARELLGEPQLAIVGSRNPSIDGKENAYRFAKSIVNVGLAVTSGMALGVDGSAHKGAIDGLGHTIAVVGTGADIVYPARHRGLADEILEKGAIVSELPLGAQPHPSNFPRRNRIISALSLGVLVVEASPKSGSLITAHSALDQGREVYAIPGSIHNPMARGCHQLLRQGAKLVESSEDIFEEISSLLAFHQLIRHEPPNAPSITTLDAESSISMFPQPSITTDLFGSHHDNNTQPVEVAVELTETEQALLQLIGYDVVSVDLTVERSELSAEEISVLMMSLELKGVIQSVPGGFQRVS